jgi:hypothetical protein
MSVTILPDSRGRSKIPIGQDVFCLVAQSSI